MGLNSSHLTYKTSARNGELSSHFLLHAIQRLMGKRSRPTRLPSRTLRSDTRKQRVFGQMSYLVCFGPTEPLPIPSQEKLHSHSYTALRQSYLSNAAFPLQGTCGLKKTQTKSCLTITSMQSTNFMTNHISTLHSSSRK